MVARVSKKAVEDLNVEEGIVEEAYQFGTSKDRSLASSSGTSKGISVKSKPKKDQIPTCPWALHISNVRNKGREIEPTIKSSNSTTKPRDLAEDLAKKYQVRITSYQISRAKTMAERKSHKQFRRIYICFGALKEGFKLGGRDILGLHGCFMKGPFLGQILIAVGIDINNGIYPVAFSLVEAETTASWTWFLECLGKDLNVYSNSNFTFISDRQKGIIPAIQKVFPSTEHGYCLSNIHENMKPRWRGVMYKNMLQKCGFATIPQEFERSMKAILDKDKALHDWLKEIPPRHWSRDYFSVRPKCDALLNNLCEVLNRQLILARDKPIITCIEYIREYMMKRMVVVHKTIAKCQGPLAPVATTIYEKIKNEANLYTVIWNGNTKYQITGPVNEKAVDMEQRTCLCRIWELMGMPCRHAVACIYNMTMNG
ncbi:uncharacterized protein LOC143625887 [Bidens hawaiensis]|uniref:uncharacterized protein LOC143625887 n=1 Tax=Bidens hawaiensis TaxID=980011 RepID=UPI004049863F